MKKQILVIGVGGMGARAVSAFAGQEHRSFARIFPLVLDTDEAFLQQIDGVKTLSLARPDSFEKIVSALREEDNNNIDSIFPCAADGERIEYGQTTPMNRGANRFRMKGLVAFSAFLQDLQSRADLEELLKKAADISLTSGQEQPSSDSEEDKEEKQTADIYAAEEYTSDKTVEVYITASMAGGTGAALFLPLARYVADTYRRWGITAHCHALLITPDALPSATESSQEVKEKANAYAALRELNAAMMQNSTDTPFERVYLMDKKPGVVGAELYASLVAQVLDVLCTQDALIKEQKQTTPYVAISLSELHYPLERLSEYVVTRTLLEQNAPSLALLSSSAQKASRLASAGDTSFARCMLDALTEHQEVTQQLFPLLDWTEDGRFLWEGQKGEQMLSRMAEECHSEVDTEEWTPLLQECKEQLQELRLKPRLLERAKAKQVKRKMLYHHVLAIGDLYQKISDSCAETFAQKIVSLTEKMSVAHLFGTLGLAQSGGDETLLRLCVLRTDVERLLQNYRVRRPANGESTEQYAKGIAESFYLPGRAGSIFKKGEYVFSMLGEASYELGEADPEKDRVNVLKQLSLGAAPVLEKWEELCAGAVLAVLAKQLDEVIAGYACLLSQADKKAEQQRAHIAELLAVQADKGALGAEKERKEQAYRLYRQERSDAMAGRSDVADAAAVWQAAVSAADAITWRRLYEDMYDRALAKLTAELHKSETYLALKKQPLLGLIEGERPKDDKLSVLSTLLEGAVPLLPLRAGMPGKRKTVLLVDTASMELAQAKAEAAEEGSGRDHMVTLLTRAGCMEAELAVSDTLPERCWRAVGLTYDFSLADVTTVSEFGEDASWYSAALKALHNSEKYRTAMWYPYLSISCSSAAVLPFIDPAMNEKAEEQTACAFLAIFLGNSYWLEQQKEDDSDPKYCFFTALGGGREAVCGKAERAVWLEDYDGLLDYIDQNESRRSLLSDMYEKLLQHAEKALPTPDPFFTDENALFRSLGGLEFVKMMRQDMRRHVDTKQAFAPLPLAQLLYQWENNCGGIDPKGRRQRILSQALLALYRLCQKATPGCTVEQREALYDRLVGSLTAEVPTACAMRFQAAVDRYHEATEAVQ